MSNSAPAIPLFGDAYMADTSHLSLEEDGAYLRLMMIAWRLPGCALPDDDTRLARMLKITPGRWSKLKPVVMSFWTLSPAGWVQGRLSKERKFVEEKRAKNKASADARWNGQPIENKQPDECERISERNAPPPPPPFKKVVTSVTTKRATRLAVDWKPDPLPPNVQELVSQWPSGREVRELDGFRDYWAKVRTKDAARTDWNATWHNRIRDQHDRIMRENRNGHVGQSHNQPKYKPSAALALYNSSFEGDDADRGHDWPALPASIGH